MSIQDAYTSPNEIKFLSALEGNAVEVDQSFIDYLNTHRILGVMAKRNKSIHQQTTAQRQALALESLKKLSELITLKKRFEEAGIRFMVLKGMALSQLLYDDFGVRQSKDIDILIEPENSLKANAILTEMGYEHTFGYEVDEGNIDVLHQRSHDVEYINKQKGVGIECHFRLKEIEYLFDEPFEALWSRQQTIMIQCQAFAFMGQEDLFVYLCMHGACHFYSRLSWLLDIVAMLERFDVDFDAVLRHAASLNCERLVAASVVLASQLVKRPIPDVIQAGYQQDKLAKKVVKWFVIGTRRRMDFNKEPFATYLKTLLCSAPGYKRYVLKRRVTGRYHGVLKYRFPKWVFCVMPVLEPVILGWKGLCRLVGR